MEEKTSNQGKRGCLTKFFIAVGIFFCVTTVLGIIMVIFDDKPKEQVTATNKQSITNEQNIISNAVPVINNDSILNEKLKGWHEDVINYKREKATSLTDINIYLAIFITYNNTINEGLSSTNNDNIKLAQDIKKRVEKIQIVEFPKLRKEYAEICAEIGWEKDMYVSVSGDKNTIINFAYAGFAANKNIKEFQENISDMVSLLRFKQTRYRWYKNASEYTYYELEVPKDIEPMVNPASN